MVERRWCPATLVEDKGEDEKEELMEQVSRMVAILIICWQLQSRRNLDENVLEQREVVGNVNDDTDKELLKQVGNAMHTGLGEFNAVGHDEEVLVEVVNVI